MTDLLCNGKMVVSSFPLTCRIKDDDGEKIY